MKYLPIDSKLFIKNRKKFKAEMQPNSLAVFNSNDIYPISADSTIPFEQHRDIFYLSGVDQEESVLVLFPNHPDENMREVLFLKETNEHIAIWEGAKLTKDDAFKASGIKTVFFPAAVVATGCGILSASAFPAPALQRKKNLSILLRRC